MTRLSKSLLHQAVGLADELHRELRYAAITGGEMATKRLARARAHLATLVGVLAEPVDLTASPARLPGDATGPGAA